jgi:hypothetical protein
MNDMYIWLVDQASQSSRISTIDHSLLWRKMTALASSDPFATRVCGCLSA